MHREQPINEDKRNISGGGAGHVASVTKRRDTGMALGWAGSSSYFRCERGGGDGVKIYQA